MSNVVLAVIPEPNRNPAKTHRKTSQLIWAAIVIIVHALIRVNCNAQSVAYTTLGTPDNPYDTSDAWLVNGTANPPEPYVAEASQFVPAASGYLTELDLALSAGNANSSANLADVYIAGNNSVGLPGSILDSYFNVPCTGPFGAPNPLTMLFSTANPYLQTGQPYWLLIEPATPTADVLVNENNQGIMAAHDVLTYRWFQEGSQTTFAFDVVVQSIVPEPSVLGLFAAGGALMLLSSRFFLRPRDSSNS